MTCCGTFWDTATALDPAATDKDEARSMRFATPEELRSAVDEPPAGRRT